MSEWGSDCNVMVYLVDLMFSTSVCSVLGILYTDSIAVRNQIIFGHSDGMCGGNNYLKNRKK